MAAAPEPAVRAGGSRRRTGIYVGVIAVAVVAIGGFVALTDLGFGFQSVHISAVDLDFLGDECDGWLNETSPGISANVGSRVAIPIELTNDGAAGSCTALNVSAAPAGFAIVSANVPLSVSAGASQILSVNVGLPSNSFSGVLTLSVGVSTTA